MITRIERKETENRANRPILRPEDISATDYDLGCRVLFSSISLALKDPAKQAQFEAWKKRRALSEVQQ